MARRRCPVCGSKQWRKEAASGLITCSEGHVLQGYRNEVREVEDIGTHQLHKRKLKSSRKKKEKQSRADPKTVYYGNRGRFHYFQCLQLVLRLQIQALVDLWKLPSEYEVVCRDIWAIHLELLPNRPPPEPLHHQRDVLGSARVPTLRDKATDARMGRDKDHDSSDDSSNEEEDDDDSEMERFMREASESPSSSEGGSDNEPDATIKEHKAKKKTRRYLDTPASNVAILALACWALRIPVMYQDFIRLIESYDLPYLDTVRLLPTSLTVHLSKYSTQGLSPYNAPSTLHLHRLTSRLAKNMYRKFNVTIPEMNALPMLWRAVHCLQGTPTLYMLSKRLGMVLSIPNTLHHSLAPVLKAYKRYSPKFHKMDDVSVEVALVSTVIIVLKLVYGLDGIKRSPVSEEDMAYSLPKLSDLLDALKEAEENEKTSTETLFSSVERKSVLDFNEEAIDEYIDFCQRVLLPREQRESNVMTEYFPLDAPTRNDQGVSSVSLPATHSAIPLNAPSPYDESGGPASGDLYKIYNARDVLGALPADLELVVRRASRWTGVSEDHICRVVEHFERRLRRWWVRHKKDHRMEGISSEEDAEEGEEDGEDEEDEDSDSEDEDEDEDEEII